MPNANPESQLLGDTAHVDPGQPLHMPRARPLVGEGNEGDLTLALPQRGPVALERDQDAAPDGRVEQLSPGKYRLVAVARGRHDVGAPQRVALVLLDGGLLQQLGEQDAAVSARVRPAAALRHRAKILDRKRQGAAHEACDLEPRRHQRLGLLSEAGRRREEPGKSPGGRSQHAHAPGVPAFGKNSCSPPILYSAIAFCPSGEITQSTKVCPSSFFTFGCFAGLTSITPYWLNRRLSPSTSMTRSPRFLNEIQVPRSERM